MSDNQVEALRHLKVFSPADFGDRRIDIIGCGATGSRIAMSIAKLGISNLHLHDFDVVEAHNIANQFYGIEDVGRPKVEALAEHIKRFTGLEATVCSEKVDGSATLGNYVFLLTDTMASRKEIFEGAIRHKPHVDCMIETRMSADQGNVYSVRPSDIDEVKFWESTLCGDDVAEEGLCGARVTVGPTAELISGHAVWAFIRLFNWLTKDNFDKERPEVEHVFFPTANDQAMISTPTAVGV